MFNEHMKKCMICNKKTFDWEKVGILVRCWSCGKAARELDYKPYIRRIK